MWCHIIIRLIFISALALVVGCAAPPQISHDDRQKITHITVKESYSESAAKLDQLLPEDGTSGFFSGALMGLAALLPGPHWIYGGPFLTVVTVPGMAYDYAKCGAAVSEVKEPQRTLQAILTKAEPRAFRKALDSELREILESRSGSKEGVDKAKISTAIEISRSLEIYRLEIILESGQLKGEGFSCRPVMRARVFWRIRNSEDRSVPPIYLEESWTSCSTPVSTESFKSWFEKLEQRTDEVTALFASLGRISAHRVLGGPYSNSPCDYGRPQPKSITGESLTVDNPDYLECVKRGRSKCDDYVSCFSQGKRQWTNRTKCD